jgi:hypothetical protein
MATSLEFDLDNFDLETIDMTNSSNNTGLGLSSMKTSTSTPTSISGLDDGDTFGLDLLMNKSKAKQDSHKSSSTQSIQHPSTNEPKQSGDGLFNKLFNNNKKTTPVINKLGAFNNNVANGSNGGLQDIDLDVELKNLDIGLDDTLNKAKNMNGPGLPKFGSSPISSMPTSNPAPTTMSYQSNPTIEMTYEEIQKSKFDLLCKFERLREKGVKIPKMFSMSSDYDEMKYEYDRLLHQRKMDNSVKMQRRMLISFITGVEWLNGRFDPFDLKLDGWSESIHEGITEYDDVFEELYEKYQGSGDMAPELKLMFMVGGSAFMYHLQNSMFKSSLPDASDVLRQNPELAKQFQEATINSMGQKAPGFAGFMGGLFGGNNQSQSVPSNNGPPLYPGGNINQSPPASMSSPGGNGGLPDLDSILKSMD